MSEMNLNVVSLAAGDDGRDDQQRGQKDQKQKEAIVIASDTDQDDDLVKTVSEYVKSCSDCGTTETSIWRNGPAGRKSLCNACYIRAHKERKKAARVEQRARAKQLQAAVTLYHMAYSGVRWTPY